MTITPPTMVHYGDHQEARAEIARLRAELAREAEQTKIVLDNYAAENQRFSDEIQRLRGALEQLRNDLAPIHLCDVISRNCKICEAVISIEAALASHPQEDKL